MFIGVFHGIKVDSLSTATSLPGPSPLYDTNVTSLGALDNTLSKRKIPGCSKHLFCVDSARVQQINEKKGKKGKN